MAAALGIGQLAWTAASWVDAHGVKADGGPRRAGLEVDGYKLATKRRVRD